MLDREDSQQVLPVTQKIRWYYAQASMTTRHRKRLYLYNIGVWKSRPSGLLRDCQNQRHWLLAHIEMGIRSKKPIEIKLKSDVLLRTSPQTIIKEEDIVTDDIVSQETLSIYCKETGSSKPNNKHSRIILFSSVLLFKCVVTIQSHRELVSTNKHSH